MRLQVPEISSVVSSPVMTLGTIGVVLFTNSISDLVSQQDVPNLVPYFTSDVIMVDEDDLSEMGNGFRTVWLRRPLETKYKTLLKTK